MGRDYRVEKGEDGYEIEELPCCEDCGGELPPETHEEGGWICDECAFKMHQLFPPFFQRKP